MPSRTLDANDLGIVDFKARQNFFGTHADRSLMILTACVRVPSACFDPLVPTGEGSCDGGPRRSGGCAS